MRKNTLKDINVFDLGSVAKVTMRPEPKSDINRSLDINCCGGKRSSFTEKFERDLRNRNRK